ncbi:hypothetical protein KKIDH5335_07310 [Vibrio fluvialis]|nr:hypothetical protein KKIDH5335_07310 [Vibrio fluvialis]
MSKKHPFMHFDVIPDHRQQGKVERKLTDIILLTICAILSRVPACYFRSDSQFFGIKFSKMVESGDLR